MIIKVVSFNLWQGGLLWQPLVKFLKQQDSDIYLLQEAYAGTKPKIEQRFRTVAGLADLFPDYDVRFAAFIGDQRSKEGLVDNGNLILSRWPMIDHQTIFFDVNYGVYDHDATKDFSAWPAGLQTAGIKLPTGQTLFVANLHGPVWLEGSTLTPRRENMAKSIDYWLKGKDLAILAGDSNAKPDNPCWQLIETPHFSVFGNQLPTTFNMKHKDKPGFATSAVDVCLLSPKVKVLSAQVLSQVDASDHLPLVFSLEI